MDETVGVELINQLKNEPEMFYNEGKSYQLLQEYFEGFQKDTLRELFYFENVWIRRVATWIASELGADGSDLLKDVLTQIDDEDSYICSYALQMVANCAYDEHIDDFVRVFSFLGYNNQAVRLSVMTILLGLSHQRINEAYTRMANNKKYDNSHRKGLLALLDADNLTSSAIVQMVSNSDAIIRKYGIIAAAKLFDKYPQLIIGATNDGDLDIREFSKQVLRVKNAVV